MNWQCNHNDSDFISVQEKQLNLEGLLYNVDDEGSTLLHLAVDSGILPVRYKLIYLTPRLLTKRVQESYMLGFGFLSYLLGFWYWGIIRWVLIRCLSYMSGFRFLTYFDFSVTCWRFWFGIFDVLSIIRWGFDFWLLVRVLNESRKDITSRYALYIINWSLPSILLRLKFNCK